MASFRTNSYIIAKPSQGRRAWTIFHARPGSTKKEAWENATDTAKVSRREFVASGWECKEIHILSIYGLPK